MSAGTTYADHMWRTANGVTTFAVLQTIAYMTAIGTSKRFEGHVAEPTTALWVIAGIVAFSGLYVFAVFACGRFERMLLGLADATVIGISKKLTWARATAIGFFGALSVAITYLVAWGSSTISS